MDAPLSQLPQTLCLIEHVSSGVPVSDVRSIGAVVNHGNGESCLVELRSGPLATRGDG